MNPSATDGATLDAPDFLAGGGEMGALIRAKDWSQSPLGPIEGWPQSLKIVIRIMLTSRYAMWMGWGSELTFFCNDAYTPTLGVKHPWALGRSARDVWAEIWREIGPRAEAVVRSGVATWDEALLLFLERSGYSEETYHTFSYSPLANDAGAIDGMLCVVTEDTERVIGVRRVALLRDVASALATTQTEDEVLAAVRVCIGETQRDLPFVLLYLFDPDGSSARLACRVGLPEGHPGAPDVIRPGGPGEAWPVAELVATGAPVCVDDLDGRFGPIPAGHWERAPRLAAVVPLAHQGLDRLAGFLAVGLNPHRSLDTDYSGFLDLLAGQIASGLANARAYEEERKRAEALAELDRAKTAFFSNVSHEFRTPLTLMLGPIEELQAADFEPGRREQIDLLHRNALRLQKLVNTLLDFSRIEAGRINAVYQPTDLAGLTAELASVFRSAVDRAGLRLIVDCPPLPEPVYVDRDMWEKIVLNLVSNAFKFTLEGEIEVKLAAGEGCVRLTVRDTGTGIARENLPHIFERFHRVEGARARTHEGTGIGLALVQELAKLHGGSVSVESEFGRGTTFTVAIPTGAAHLPADRIGGMRSLASTALGARHYVEEAIRWLPEDQRPAEGPAAVIPDLDDAESGIAPEAGDVARPRVVLADDNADMREYIRRLLSQRYDVEAVPDGEAALAAVRREPPGLVLTDVMMPNLDGYGLLRALRDDPATKTIPVIMLSARAGEEARVEGIEAGADDYLTKPFGARELIARVASHFELARVRREAAGREQSLRHAAEEAEEKFRIALKNSPIIVYTTDRMLRYTWIHNVHPAFAPDDLIGRRDDEIPAIENAAEIVAFKQSVLDSRQGARREMTLVIAGRTEVYDLTAEPLYDDDGSVVGLTIAAMDVTERKKAEEALREANRMKDEFLATLSHELRTPLNAIVGWTALLRRVDPGPAELNEGLEVIERNAKVQAQLIEDLLDVSRIISGKLRLDVQRVVLADVIHDAVAAVATAADARGVRVVPTLDPLVGSVSGDPGRLQQVFWNLLSNAVKFTPRGGRVQIVLERVNSHVEVSVIDTGQGIKPEFLPHIFERFRQSDSSTTRRHGGLGLGLAIVKQLVELHGGSVRAKSPGEGAGSTFTVSLPILAVHEAPAARARPGDPIDGELAEPPSLRGVRVLVVDDEPDARELLRRVLVGCEAVVSAAGSVVEALAILERQRFDVLVSDIGMPSQDGYDLLRIVRSRGLSSREVPAVALTAYARPEDRRRALLAGFQTHMTKPVDPAELIAVVGSLAGRTGISSR